jgi:hypothetical protein
MVHDLYVNMYGTDQQPQHPHSHNQHAGGVVVMSDITQHIDFLPQDRQQQEESVIMLAVKQNIKIDGQKKGNQEKEESSKGTKQEKRKRRDTPH